MTKLVLDAETIAKIRAAGPDVLIVGEDGHEVGRIHVERSTDHDPMYMSPEERAEAMKGPGRPLADILRDLRAKYGD